MLHCQAAQLPAHHTHDPAPNSQQVQTHVHRVGAGIRCHEPLRGVQQRRQAGVQQVLVQLWLVAGQQQLKAGQLQLEVLEAWQVVAAQVGALWTHQVLVQPVWCTVAVDLQW